MTGRIYVSAIVLITVPAKRSGDVVRALMANHQESVLEAAAVYGEADVIARIDAPSIAKLHDIVMDQIQPIEHVTATRTFIIDPQIHVTPHRSSPVHLGVSAFVLITVPAKQSKDVVDELVNRHSESVAEAAATYGQADVIAKIETASVESLHDIIMNGIQTIPYVTFTRTFIIIPQLHEFGENQ